MWLHPERINPGDKKHTLKNIIKVTSGTNKRVSTFVDKLYKSIISAWYLYGIINSCR